jgi:hypothetical protein
VVVVLMLCGSTARAQGSLDAESIYLGTYGGTICRVRTGSGAPSGGNTCDTYVDTATGNLYTKRAGTWTLIPRTEISNTWGASQTVTGTMSATTFAGSGASLTNVPAAQVTGANALPDAVLSTNVPLMNNGNVFTQKQTITVNGEALKIGPATGTNATYQHASNTGDHLLFGLESSTGTTIFSGTNPYAAVFGVQGAHDVAFATNNTMRLQIDSSGNLLPYDTSAYNIGSSTRLWNHAYFAQIDATLFSKSTQTLFGGWLAVTKNAGTFAVAVASGNTTIDFGQAMVANQFVIVRGTDTGGSVTEEYIKVLTLSAGTVYNVTRNLSGGGAKNWAKGTPYAVRGVAGDGWLELNAFDTPRMSIFTQGSLYNNSTETVRVGHLTGMPNSSSGIGIYMGDSTNYFRWDGSAFKFVSATATIDSTGVTVVPNTSTTYASTNAYRFTAPTGDLGMSGYDTTSRGLNISATWTGASTRSSSILMVANGSSSASMNAALSLSSSGVSGGANVIMTTDNFSIRASGNVAPMQVNIAGSLALGNTIGGTGVGGYFTAGNAGEFSVNGSSGALTVSASNSGIPLTISQSYAANTSAFFIDITRTDSTTAVGELRFNSSSGQKFGVGTAIRVGAVLEFNSGSANLGYFSTSVFNLNSSVVLTMPGLASLTGTRYLCINTSGTVSSSATACSGT